MYLLASEMYEAGRRWSGCKCVVGVFELEWDVGVFDEDDVDIAVCDESSVGEGKCR